MQTENKSGVGSTHLTTQSLLSALKLDEGAHADLTHTHVSLHLEEMCGRHMQAKRGAKERQDEASDCLPLGSSSHSERHRGCRADE